MDFTKCLRFPQSKHEQSKKADSEDFTCDFSCRYSILENGFLHIQSAHVTDTGRYLCMATNAAGTDRRRIDLQVHGKYPFIDNIQSLCQMLFDSLN